MPNASSRLLLLLPLAALAVSNPVYKLHPRILEPLAPTAPWITVDETGLPSTVTPVPTTISGSAAIASGAPNELTGTVFTSTDFKHVRIYTSTGAPPAATARNGAGAGAYAPCRRSKEDEGAPFCEPAPGAKLTTDNIYYIVWDPTYFMKAPNATEQITLRIQAQYINEATPNPDLKFESESISAFKGFFAWTPDPAFILRGTDNSTIQLLVKPVSAFFGQPAKALPDIMGPRITLARPTEPEYHGFTVPKGAELYIGLPVIAGFIIICVVGGFFWNRKARKIGLGNVMSRSRHGYGIGKSRAQRLGARVRKSVLGGVRRGGRKEGAIQLMEREVEPGYEYRDHPEQQRRGDGARFDADRFPPPNLPRRDSDALGSLAGSPTEERANFYGQEDERSARRGHGNAFRDEIRRQERERF